MSSSERTVTPRDDLNIPPDSDSLIDYLNQAIPHCCIRPDEDMIAAQRYSAQRELVDQLLAMRDEDRNMETAGDD